MSVKTTTQHLFDVKLNWLAGTRGVLSATDAVGTIHVATPPEFGGSGNPWTPEHLFLGAISSCFMSTYIAFTKKLKLEIANLTCEVIGTIEIVDGRYKFTTIHVYPKVFIADEELRDRAETAMEKAHKYCLISNSIDAGIFYHGEVLIVPEKNEIHEYSSL